MIPNGLNPHGLENRTLTFCVLENNIPVFTYQSTNRLYCWASFPEQVKQFLVSASYIGSGDVVRLSDRPADTQESWNNLQKYVSKEQSGTHYMVHGDQTFYYQVWVQSVVPDFATIYILDTSGSMVSSDYTQAKYAITGEIYEYNCYDHTMSDSKIYVYSAAKLSSMDVSETVFGTIKFGHETLSGIWNAVSPFIDNVNHNTTSESVMTNLYYSIADSVKRMFYGVGATKPGRSCAISSMSFIVLTDESLFTWDTTSDVGQLSNPSSKFYSEWFARWQASATNKFDVTTKSWGQEFFDEEKHTMTVKLTNALKQMSYYYGVNFSWGLYGGLAPANDKKWVLDRYYSSGPHKGELQYDGTGFWLNKVDTGWYIDPDTGETKHKTDIDAGVITYVGGDAWDVPKKYHVSYPHSEMCRVSLTIPAQYISEDGTSASTSVDGLKDSKIMHYDDQFDQELTLAHFHKDSATDYSAFRFYRYDPRTNTTFIDKPVTLPLVAEMNLLVGNYHWETYGYDERFSKKVVACGGTYDVNHDDLKSTAAKWTIQFMLVKDA